MSASVCINNYNSITHGKKFIIMPTFIISSLAITCGLIYTVDMATTKPYSHKKMINFNCGGQLSQDISYTFPLVHTHGCYDYHI